MNDTWSLLFSLVTGVLLGAVYFWGLWWTVKKGVSSQHPALWFVGSLLFRISVVLTGFYFIGRGHWIRLMVCLLGFILARIIVKRMVMPSRDKKAGSAQEDSHEPES